MIQGHTDGSRGASTARKHHVRSIEPREPPHAPLDLGPADRRSAGDDGHRMRGHHDRPRGDRDQHAPGRAQHGADATARGAAPHQGVHGEGGAQVLGRAAQAGRRLDPLPLRRRRPGMGQGPRLWDGSAAGAGGRGPERSQPAVLPLRTGQGQGRSGERPQRGAAAGALGPAPERRAGLPQRPGLRGHRRTAAVRGSPGLVPGHPGHRQPGRHARRPGDERQALQGRRQAVGALHARADVHLCGPRPGPCRGHPAGDSVAACRGGTTRFGRGGLCRLPWPVVRGGVPGLRVPGPTSAKPPRETADLARLSSHRWVDYCSQG